MKEELSNRIATLESELKKERELRFTLEKRNTTLQAKPSCKLNDSFFGQLKTRISTVEMKTKKNTKKNRTQHNNMYQYIGTHFSNFAYEMSARRNNRGKQDPEIDDDLGIPVACAANNQPIYVQVHGPSQPQPPPVAIPQPAPRPHVRMPSFTSGTDLRLFVDQMEIYFEMSSQID